MLFRLPSEEDLTDNKLNEFIAKHNAECAFRFKHLKDAYETDYQIFHQKPKPDYKPDNRIAVNFAKYMVDTFNGYFIGNPIKISVDGDAAGNIKKYVELLDQYNDQDDNNAELSKICCIYGKGYEMYYVDELGNIGITYLTPFDAFMIYDDSVLCRERYFVRLYIDSTVVYPMRRRYVGSPRRESLSGRKKKRYMDLTGCQLQSMWRTRNAHVSLNRQSR